MDSAKKLLIALSIVVVITFFAPSIAVGQSTTAADWPVRATFVSPIRIGSMVLDPGTYDIQLTSNNVSRNVVLIYSVDQQRWLGMVMGINDTRQGNSKKSGFTFEDFGDNGPAKLECWFYPGWERGIKFVYRDAKIVDTIAQARPAVSK